MEKLKKNKFIIIFLILLFFILVYCHFNTFIISDDLPYSLYLRGYDRVSSISEIIKNQMSDYVWINARVFVHGIVQFLLMFDKSLWSILNPLVIISIICLMSYLLWLFTKKKIKPIWLVLTSTLAFLLLDNYKNLIYWVAGSVNYVWMFLVMLGLILYYYKFGLLKKPVLTFSLFTGASILCESTAIFSIVLIIMDAIIQIFVLKKNKKNLIKYLVFLIGSICSMMFLLLSPSTASRFTWGGDEWSNLSLFGKIFTAIPIISNNLFSFSIYNLIPLFLILSIFFYFFKDNKKLKILSLGIVILYLINIFLNNGWISFMTGIGIFICQIFIFYENKDFKLITLVFTGYALAYSLAITPEYSAGRTGFFTSLFFSIFTIYNMFYRDNVRKVIKGIVILGLVITISFELITYTYIGIIKNERLKSIGDVLSGKSDTVYTKEIKEPFNKFHIEANEPASRDYWAIAMFERYYGLPEGVKIKLIK